MLDCPAHNPHMQRTSGFGGWMEYDLFNTITVWPKVV